MKRKIKNAISRKNYKNGYASEKAERNPRKVY